jgi:dynein heavy chain
MKLFTSLQGEQLYLPSISLQDGRINDGKYFKRIIARNTIGPQKHIAAYEKFKPLLTLKAEKRVDDFLRDKHELDEYETVIFFTN